MRTGVLCRSLKGIIAAAQVCCLLAAAQAADADSREDQIERIEQELSREQEQYHKFDLKEKELLDRLAELEARIEEKRAVLEELQTRLEKHRLELKEQETLLHELDERLDSVRKRLGTRLQAYYKHSRRGYLRLLTTAGEPDEFRRRLYYLRVIMEEDRRLMEELDSALSMHQEMVESIEEKVRTISRLEQEEAERLAGLNADQEEKVLLLMKVHKEKEFYETAVKELQAAAEELRKTITDLDSKSEWPEKLTSDFAQHKGRLPRPFDGKVIRSPSNADSGLASKGVFIEGSKGGKVRAVYDGRVEYSGWLKGYGRIVIINHGSRYFSVSAQLSEILCRKGQVVEQGEVIGFAGRIESLSAPGLYFELRKAGEPMDPLAWLKAH